MIVMLRFASSGENLVVLAVGLSLGIQDSRPVVCLVVGLSIDINLHFNVILALANRVSGNTDRGEGSSDKLSNSRWAPCSHNISSLQGELGSKDGILDSSIVIDLTERKRLVHWGALVAKCVNGSRGVDGNADGKSSGDTRSGLSRIREILDIDAWYILKLRLELGVKRGARNLQEKNEPLDDPRPARSKANTSDQLTPAFCTEGAKAAAPATREAMIESFILSVLWICLRKMKEAVRN